MEDTKKIFEAYKDAGWSMSDTEDQWKIDNDADTMPNAIKNIFKEVFAEERKGCPPWD